MWNKLRNLPLLPAFLALAAVVYVVVRAWVIPFTWDESFSWLEFVRGDDLWPKDVGTMSANNHLLNTWLMKLCKWGMGSSEFSLRLPNVLAGIVYILSVAWFSCREKNTFRQVAVFLLLAGHPYLLEFFSIARGYGLANGIMLAGFWMLWRWCRDNSLRDAFFGLSLLALAVFANLTFLHVLLGATAAVLLRLLTRPSLRQWEAKFVRMQFIGFPALVVLLLIVPYSMKLKYAGALFFGVRGSWFNGTWRSLIDRMLYGITFPPFLKDCGGAFFIVVAIAGIIAAAVFFLKQWRKTLSADQSFLLVLSGAAAVSVFGPLLQSAVMGTNLLFERTALFYVPLLMLLFVQLLRLVADKPKIAWVIYVPLPPALIILPFILNVSYQRDWPDERAMRGIAAELNRLAEKEMIVAGIEMQFLPGLNYLQSTDRLSQNAGICEIKNSFAPYQWLLIYPRDKNKYPGYRLYKKLNEGKILLMQNNSFNSASGLTLITENFDRRAYKQAVASISGTPHGTSNVLFGGAGEVYPYTKKFAIPDSLNDKYLHITTELDAYRSQSHFGASILYYIKRKNTEHITLTEFNLLNHLPDKNMWRHIYSRNLLDEPVCTGDTLITMFFVRSDDIHYFDNIRVKAGVAR
jgi:uncharacterized membrane protein YgdD (TMEM256/DUF423 family)